MKVELIAITFFLTASFHGISQEANQLRAYYGIADSELLRNEELAGAGSYDNQNAYEIGLNYLRTLTEKLSIETGVQLFHADVYTTPAFTGTPVTTTQEELSLVSIPIYANYTIGRYFYIHAGPTIDFQNGDKSYDSQSGIGYGIGIGGNYQFNQLTVFINPNFKQRAFIPFEKEEYQQRLTQFGLQFGIGYEF